MKLSAIYAVECSMIIFIYYFKNMEFLYLIRKIPGVGF